MQQLFKDNKNIDIHNEIETISEYYEGREIPKVVIQRLEMVEGM